MPDHVEREGLSVGLEQPGPLVGFDGWHRLQGADAVAGFPQHEAVCAVSAYRPFSSMRTPVQGQYPDGQAGGNECLPVCLHEDLLVGWAVSTAPSEADRIPAKAIAHAASAQTITAPEGRSRMAESARPIP
jgi:hypothetical protein